VPADSVWLSKGLVAMARFFVGDGTLRETLQRIADLAVEAVPGADMAGMTMLVEGRAKTAVFTDETSPEIDAAQYETGIGPCLDSFRHQQVYRIDFMEKDRQWPPFSEAAGAHGIQSSMSVPLVARHEGVGALNFYSRSTEAFSDADVELGLQFATQAASVLANSQAYWDAHHLTQDLVTAMTSRTTVEQAKGIVMGSRGCNAEEALQVLVRTSQRENRKLREIAEEMVTGAGRDVVVGVQGVPSGVAVPTASKPVADDGPSETVRAAQLTERIGGLVSRLIRRSTRLGPDDLARVVAEESRRGGFHDASVLLVDLEQRDLIPLPPVLDDLGPQDVDTSVAGRAFQLERPVAVRSGDVFGIWMPLVDGSERLGVLYLRSPAVSDEVLDRCKELAGVVAELIVSKAQYGDALAVARRKQDMTLAAEMRWAMLPPLTFTGEAVGIACLLEPAYDVAGDAFDYAVNDGVLHLAVMDAMGHGLEASQMANLATSAYRLARRRGMDLLATYRLMDDSVREQFGDASFVTAQLATLDTRTGTLHWLNAGHPQPMLLRGGRVAFELHCPPSLPLGLGDVPSSVARVDLEPGDAALFITDGIIEANSPGGEQFGRDRLVDLTRRAFADRQTLAETVRRLARAVRAHREGPLADDATILFVDWHPETEP